MTRDWETRTLRGAINVCSGRLCEQCIHFKRCPGGVSAFGDGMQGLQWVVDGSGQARQGL